MTRSPASYEVTAAPGIGEVGPGDDLAELVAGTSDLRDGDVVVVTSKVVSKAEGRVVRADEAVLGSHQQRQQRRILDGPDLSRLVGQPIALAFSQG